MQYSSSCTLRFFLLFTLKLFELLRTEYSQHESSPKIGVKILRDHHFFCLFGLALQGVVLLSSSVAQIIQAFSVLINEDLIDDHETLLFGSGNSQWDYCVMVPEALIKWNEIGLG